MKVKELFEVGKALSYEDALKALRDGDTIYIKENKCLYKIIERKGLFYIHEEDEAEEWSINFDNLSLLSGMDSNDYFFKVNWDSAKTTLLFIQQCQESYRNFNPNGESK